MRTALFGGSFDPPHKGHAAVAGSLLRAGLADEVWLVPCGSHPFGRDLSPARHRIAMSRLILRPGMSVCTYEADKDEPSYSVDTLDALRAQHPDRVFSWLMGSDQLPAFDEWKDYARMLQTYAVYVYPRRGHPFEPLYDRMTPLVSMPEIDVSSTAVRRSLLDGADPSLLVEPPVEAYIRRHSLYAPQHAAAL